MNHRNIKINFEATFQNMRIKPTIAMKIAPIIRYFRSN